MYFRKKGTIEKVTRMPLLAHVRMQDGHVLELPERKLETVLPALGRQVRVVKACAALPALAVGSLARMTALNETGHSVSVVVEGDDRFTEGVPYDCVCKVDDKRS
jgi:hypothetical protein